MLREKKRHGEESTKDKEKQQVPEQPAGATRAATVLPARESAPSPALVLPLSASPTTSPRSEALASSRSQEALTSARSTGELRPLISPGGVAPSGSSSARSRADSSSQARTQVFGNEFTKKFANLMFCC